MEVASLVSAASQLVALREVIDCPDACMRRLGEDASSGVIATIWK